MTINLMAPLNVNDQTSWNSSLVQQYWSGAVSPKQLVGAQRCLGSPYGHCSQFLELPSLLYEGWRRSCSVYIYIACLTSFVPYTISMRAFKRTPFCLQQDLDPCNGLTGAWSSWCGAHSECRVHFGITPISADDRGSDNICLNTWG